MGICVLVVFGILAHGGVEEWAHAVLEIGAGLLFVWWVIQACWRQEEQFVVPAVLLPLFGLLFVVTLQWLLHRTASAHDTTVDLQLLVADVLIVFLAAQSFRTLADFRGLVWFIMALGFLVSIFGILQHLTFNGKLYWFREMRFGGIPFGPYVNRNHFAGFAELVIPVSLVPLLLGKVRRERWFIVGLFAVVPIGALFFSASRGGIVSFGVELGVIAIWFAVRRIAGRQLLSAAAVLLFAFLMVSWLGVRQALERFSSMQSLEVTRGKRTSMAADTWHIFLDHPFLGTGLGTLQDVFPPYETQYDGKVVNHTHNDYLEALAETGIAGGIFCVWFLGGLFFESLRRLSPAAGGFASTVQLSGLVACTGFLTHSLVDFNLHIPGNALLFFLSAYVATADIRLPVPQLSGPPRHRHRHRKHS